MKSNWYEFKCTEWNYTRYTYSAYQFQTTQASIRAARASTAMKPPPLGPAIRPTALVELVGGAMGVASTLVPWIWRVRGSVVRPLRNALTYSWAPTAVASAENWAVVWPSLSVSEQLSSTAEKTRSWQRNSGQVSRISCASSVIKPSWSTWNEAFCIWNVAYTSHSA